MQQRTLAAPSAPVCGVGLHSGQAINMRLCPAECGTGLRFVRTDLGTGASIPVKAGNVTDTLLATTLESDGAQVSTVEHLLFALCICGVDNAVIEVDGPEVPIMDGSALPFVLVIRDTGLVEQDGRKKFIQVKGEVEVELPGQPGRQARFEPGDAPSWEVSVAFSNPVISRTAQDLGHDLKDFAKSMARIAGARTFGFVRDVDYLRAKNRALGGTLDNAVVLDEKRVLNTGGLRQKDEFVAHKILDVIGDCYIEGKIVLGSYHASMPGHKLNNQLMRELLSDENAWREVDSDDLEEVSLPDFGPLQTKPVEIVL